MEMKSAEGAIEGEEGGPEKWEDFELEHKDVDLRWRNQKEGKIISGEEHHFSIHCDVLIIMTVIRTRGEFKIKVFQ